MLRERLLKSTLKHDKDYLEMLKVEEERRNVRGNTRVIRA